MIRTPFLTVNPKSYLFGEALMKLALKADELAEKYDVDIYFTAPLIELSDIIRNTKFIIPTAQHMDDIIPGTGMGYASPEILAHKGVKATFLNHAEHPIRTSTLVNTIKKAKEVGIITLVCADSVAEARALSVLNPDIILCEPTSLIGTGQTSDDEYIKETNEAVRMFNPDIYVLQAAGVSNGFDVERMLRLGADGTGATSGIVNADDPLIQLEKMVQALVKFKNEVKV